MEKFKRMIVFGIMLIITDSVWLILLANANISLVH